MPPRSRVLVSLVDDKQEFQRSQAAAARAVGLRAGLDVDVVFAEDYPVLQLQQIFRQLGAPADRRPAAVVAHSASALGLDGAARASVEAGIGWVLLSDTAPYLEKLRREFPDRLIASATVDNREAGRLQARLLRVLLPRGGSILTVEGPPDSAATGHRRLGLAEGLEGAPIEVVKALCGSWTADGAEQAVSLWLRLAARGRKPDAVAAQNDAMGLGARRALQAVRPQWADVPIIGCDGLPAGGQRLVHDRVLTATVVTGATAGPGVELVARWLRGEPVPPQTVIAPSPYPLLEELARRSQLTGAIRAGAVAPSLAPPAAGRA